MTRTTITRSRPGRLGDERGSALVVALLSLLLLTALGLALTLTTTTETAIAANQRMGQEVMNAADSAIERAMQDLLAIPDWNRVLSGAEQSSFVDGGPGGSRTLPDGRTINLTEIANLASCGHTAAVQRRRHRHEFPGAPLADEQPGLAALRVRPGDGPPALHAPRIRRSTSWSWSATTRPRPTAIR